MSSITEFNLESLQNLDTRLKEVEEKHNEFNKLIEDHTMLLEDHTKLLDKLIANKENGEQNGEQNGGKQRKQKKQRGGDAWQHAEAVYGGISQQQAAPGSNVIASRSVSGGGGAPAPFAHSELGSNTNQPHPLSPPTQTGGRRKSRKNRSKRQQKTRQQRRQ